MPWVPDTQHTATQLAVHNAPHLGATWVNTLPQQGILQHGIALHPVQHSLVEYHGMYGPHGIALHSRRRGHSQEQRNPPVLELWPALAQHAFGCAPASHAQWPKPPQGCPLARWQVLRKRCAVSEKAEETNIQTCTTCTTNKGLTRSYLPCLPHVSHGSGNRRRVSPDVCQGGGGGQRAPLLCTGFPPPVDRELRRRLGINCTQSVAAQSRDATKAPARPSTTHSCRSGCCISICPLLFVDASPFSSLVHEVDDLSPIAFQWYLQLRHTPVPCDCASAVFKRKMKSSATFQRKNVVLDSSLLKVVGWSDSPLKKGDTAPLTWRQGPSQESTAYLSKLGEQYGKDGEWGGLSSPCALIVHWK